MLGFVMSLLMFINTLFGRTVKQNGIAEWES